MLSVEHVTKRYGKFTALEDVNLAFQPGVYGLLAPNGAGKTTLIKLLATLLFPTEGKILWDGEDIHALGAEYWAICLRTLDFIPPTPPGSSSATPLPSSACPNGRQNSASQSCWTWWAWPTRRTRS